MVVQSFHQNMFLPENNLPFSNNGARGIKEQVALWDCRLGKLIEVIAAAEIKADMTHFIYTSHLNLTHPLFKVENYEESIV